MYIYSSWFFIWMVFEECSLTRLESSVRLIINNIRKASTEKVVYVESSRESGIWWKPLMRKVDENHSRAVAPKIGF